MQPHSASSNRDIVEDLPDLRFLCPNTRFHRSSNGCLAYQRNGDRKVQYEWIQYALGLRKDPVWDFSCSNLIRTVLPKRKLTKIADEGKVWGWDDPRMPTIRGIVRRGVVVPALREFILEQGPSLNILNLEWGALWAMSQKYIDQVATRQTAIVQAQVGHCQVFGIDGPDVAIKPKHAKNLSLGSKQDYYDKAIVLEQADAWTFKKDEEITLMNWGNAYERNITKNGEGKVTTALDLELHLEGDVKKTEKVTWLAAVITNIIPVDLITFDYLITKDKLEKEDSLECFLTPVTKHRNQAFADCNMMELQQGPIVQFERKGYHKLDVSYKGDGSKIVFFDIPSGKS
jgi:glutamyl-tRNA synthetase